MNKRDEYLDLLRTIGILGIFLAHVTPPFIIHQLRIFDVILMVILSGYLYKKPKCYIEYIFKRIKRLIFPTYIALTLFFSLLYILEKIFNIDLKGILNIKMLISSYLLISGIGFVWIIRIYLGVAIFAPIILRKLTFKKLIFYYIILEIFINISLYYFNFPIIEIVVFQLLPYCLLFCYGSLLRENKVPQRFVTIILGIVLIIAFFVNLRLDLQKFKYPPRLFYIFYGVFITNLLFLFKDKIKIKNLFLNQFCSYVGKSTMWIYLIHIFVFYFLRFIEKRIELYWLLEYLILVLFSCMSLYLKDILLNFLYKYIKNKELLNIFKG